MPSMKLSAESGNAPIEFIAFALLVFAPLATFAAESSNAWVAKQQALTAATQLARAYALSPSAFETLMSRYRGEYPSLKIETTQSKCCVQVIARLGETWATAKQVT
jgi:hypothetical protein